MKNRFVLAAGLALVVVALATVWLAVSRLTAPATVADPPPSVRPSPTTLVSDVPTPSTSPTVALVVPLDGLGGAGAFARAGDHVAVLAFVPGLPNQGNSSTRVLLPDVSVLVGSSDTVLTVAVTPERSLLIESTRSLGVQLFALLRPRASTGATSLPAVVSELDLKARLRPSP